jgi:hypothetical protein
LEGKAKRGTSYQENEKWLKWKIVVDSAEDGFFSQFHFYVSSSWVQRQVFPPQKRKKIQWNEERKN